MDVDTDAMLQAYGMASAFPEKWQNSGVTSALASLEAGDSPHNGVNVDDLLDTLTASHAVAQDEADPLGSGLTILQLLKQHGGVIPKTAAERAVYMPSSTSFDPRKFLADCHGSASLADLQRGLVNLRQHMTRTEQGGRRETVDKQYESYVTNKQQLDEVMLQLNLVGVRDDTGYAMHDLRSQLEDARNELAIRARPIDSVSAEKERLENALRALETHRTKLDTPRILKRLAEQNEHDQFVREYKKGTRLLANTWGQSSDPIERQLGQYMAEETQKVRSEYISQLHAELMRTPADGAYAPLITKLIDLGASGNPAVEWLEHNIAMFAQEIDDLFAMLDTTAARNLSEAQESGRKRDMISYLRALVPAQGQVSTKEICDQLTNSIWVDSEGIITQWAQLVDGFDQLRRILHRCAVFFQEFLSLSEHSSASSTSWQLTSEESELVASKCQELIDASSRRIVEYLTSPASNTVALPVAASHARNSASRMDADTSDHLKFMPLSSNSLAVAKYLSRILDILSRLAMEMTAVTSDPVKSAVFQIREQFVKTLCECWTRDAKQLGQIQDWSRLDHAGGNQPRLPQYFAAYHCIVLGNLRFMLDQNRGSPAPPELVNFVASAFPVALSFSVRSIETALVDSTRSISLADSQQAEMRAQLLPASLSQDAKLLVTLSYLETLRFTGLQQVYEQFQKVFPGVSLTAIMGEITPEVDKISQQLFDIYIRKKRSKLSQIITQEFQRLVPTWRDDTKQVRRISNYIYECLMVLVDTHALFTESCPQMTRPAVLELFKHLLAVVLGQLRELDELNRFGTLQNIADLEFMRWVLSQLPEAGELQQSIFVTIRHISTDEDVWRLSDGPRGAIKGPLTEAVRQSHFSFEAFKSFNS